MRSLIDECLWVGFVLILLLAGSGAANAHCGDEYPPPDPPPKPSDSPAGLEIVAKAQGVGACDPAHSLSTPLARRTPAQPPGPD